MSIKLPGATNGSVEIDVPAAIGSDLSVTIPATAGDIVVKGTDGSVDLGAIDIAASAPADSVNIDSSGNLGIGTASPSESLEVSGNGLKVSGQSSGITDEGITFDWDSGSNNGRIFSESAGSSNLLFYTTNSGTRAERMRISANGTATFKSNLIVAEGSSFGQWQFTEAGGAGVIRFTGYNSSSVANITMATDGTAAKVGGGTWASTSDSRVKENISDYTSGLSQLQQLRPRLYRYIGNEHTYIGLVAQEAEGAMPELVTQGTGTLPDGTEVDDFRTLDQTPLTFALINAVKEMSTRIEALEAEVTALKGGAS